MNIWWILIAGGLITYGIRLSFILLLEKISVPDWFKKALRFVPPAVLSAIILPGLFAPNGSIDLTLHNTQLLAGAVSILVAWKTKNVILTILVGAVVLILFQWLIKPA
jgi:branched-subunit amino acid transport protein